jgi:hypothetical protein
MRHLLEGVCHGRLDKMQDGDANGNARGIHYEKHPQLVKQVTGTRFGISPKAVAREVVNDRADKRYASCKNQAHVEEMGQQIHDPEIERRPDRAHDRKLQEARPFFISTQDHPSPSLLLK